MLMPSLPKLETERLWLREITPNDAHDIFQYFSKDEVTRFYNLESFERVEQAEQLIEQWKERFEHNQVIRWGIALKSDDRVIGTCGFHGWVKKHYKAEMGYELSPQYWRQGYMMEAIQKIMEYGFDHLELNRIEAVVVPENAGSRNLLSKIGFREEGLLQENYYWKNQFVDTVLYALLHKDFKRS